MPADNMFQILNMIIDPVGSGAPYNIQGIENIRTLHFDGCHDELSDQEITGLKFNVKMSALHHVRIGHMLFMNTGEVLR